MADRPSSLQWNFARRVMKNAWHNLMRNKLLTVATVFIIALMLFVFNLVLALSLASDSVIEAVGKKFDISIEINEGVENYTVQSFIQTLSENPQIKEVIFVGKDEALKDFSSKYPNVTAFLDYNDLENPLPDVVRLVTDTVESNNEVIQFLESAQFSSIVNQDELIQNFDQKERNEKILAITQSIKRVSFWLIIIFAIVGVMIIFNSININIHSHEKEIQIMKLVGAKYGFIRGGYVLEGLFFAILALLISLLFSRLVLAYLAQNLVTIVTNETLVAGLNAILIHFQDNFWLTLGWQFLLVMAAGLVSSYLAIELYLRKQQAF